MTAVRHSIASEALRRTENNGGSSSNTRAALSFNAQPSLFTTARKNNYGASYNFGEIRGKNYGDHMGGERPHHGGHNFFAGGPNGDYGHRAPEVQHKHKGGGLFGAIAGFLVAGPLGALAGALLGKEVNHNQDMKDYRQEQREYHHQQEQYRD